MLVLCSILALVATYRATVYALDDDVFNAPRGWLKDRSKWIAKLVSCPWCMSTWLGAPIAAAVAVFVAAGQRSDRIVFGVLLWWTASAVTGVAHKYTHRPKPLLATLIPPVDEVHPIVVDGRPFHPIDLPDGAVTIGHSVFAPIATTPNLISGR